MFKSPATLSRSIQACSVTCVLACLRSNDFYSALATFKPCNANKSPLATACTKSTQRLARWILMTQDRVHTDTLPLTHDLLAGMLGSRRASVTVAAGALQKAGAIEYRRGKLHILQRDKLEEAACECYVRIRSQLQSFVQSFDTYRPYLF